MVPEPAAVRSAAPRLRAPKDAATLLSLFVLLLFAIPSRLVFAPLGGAGTPAQVLGMGALLWWAAHRLGRRTPVTTGGRAVRCSIYLFALAVGLSYVAATVRPIEPVELRAADRGLLTVCAMLGILLVFVDGVPSRARLDVVLRRIVLAGGCVAVLGLVQFQTGMAFTNLLKLPGLSENAELVGVNGRGGLNRSAGTATHPIEFGVVIAIIMPLALHYALTDAHRSRLRRWLPVIAIGLAIPVAVSRSAIVCTVVVLLFMIPTWSRAVRRRAYAAILGIVAGVTVAVPGMLGTLTGLFVGIAEDDSALSRTDSYTVAFGFVQRAPWFGRGHLTFLPKYRILDNQFLLSLIEMGIFGLVALVTLLVTGVVCARRIRRSALDPVTRQLAQSLAAAVAAGACSFAFFDALSFPQETMLMVVLLGAIGCLHRLGGTTN